METIYHPAFDGLINAQVDYIPDDPEGQTAGTVALMRKYAVADAQSPEIRDIAAGIRAANPGASPEQLARAAWQEVKGSVTFAEDQTLIGPTGYDTDPAVPITEALIRPRDLVRMCQGDGCRRVGDCDDFSMYLAAILTALEIPAKFATVAADPANPDVYSHVYVVAYPEGRRLPLDASHGPSAGWETSNYTRIREWPLNDMGHGLLTVAALVALLYYVGKGGL